MPGDDEWFEVGNDLWLDPKTKPKKLKPFADAQIPRAVITKIAKHKIPIYSPNLSERRAADVDVLTLAHRKGVVLKTLDQDFWSDRKYPIHLLNGGIIYIAESPEKSDQIIQAFSLVYACFARSYSLDWWRYMKVKAVVGEFELKMRGWQGKIVRYRMKLRGQQVVAKGALNFQHISEF